MQKELDAHIARISESLSGSMPDIEKAAEIIKTAKKSRGRVWTAGNGGSLTIAQHFAQDLIKSCGVDAQCLSDPSIITAYGNDEGFHRCFDGPLDILRRDNDAIVVFSCSGKSTNLLGLAVRFRHKMIAVTGTDGGMLKDYAGACIHSKSRDYDVCETAFSVAADLVIRKLKGAF